MHGELPFSTNAHLMIRFERYFLITPARNEAKFIEKTIVSVIAQTIKPVRWSIVSDGSMDQTDTIALRYSELHPFIKVFRATPNSRYNASSKVNAFNHAYLFAEDLKYDFIGNLDADVSFAPDYFEKILKCFACDPRLGLAGGRIFEEVWGQKRPIWAGGSMDSVSGAVQLFRKECFVSIGGYLPLKNGGIDSAAEITARAKGWKVRTFPEMEVMHLKPLRTGAKSVLVAKFRQGRSNYQLGYHPLFHIALSLYHFRDRPCILAGISITCGYMWGMINGDKRQLPPTVVSHLRKEQMTRLFNILRGRPCYPLS